MMFNPPTFVYWSGGNQLLFFLSSPSWIYWIYFLFRKICNKFKARVKILKTAVKATHFITFLLLVGIVYMGGRGAVDFGVSQEDFAKYLPLGFAISLVSLTVISSLMIITTELIFSNSKNKSYVGLSFFFAESLFLAYSGYQINYYSERMFGPICLCVGIAAIVLTFILFVQEVRIKEPKKIRFNFQEFMKFPGWGKTIKGGLLIFLAFIFGSHQSYFGTSFFGMFVGWSVGNTLIAEQYPLIDSLRERRTNKVSRVVDLLNQGCPVNEKSFLNGQCMGTPIEIATVSGDVRTTGILLDRGATMETCNEHPVHQMISRTTNNKNEELFLKRGLTDPNKTYSGDYPLNIALKRCLNTTKESWTEERLRLYLAYKADPNIASGKPIYIAAKRNCVNAVKILIEAGANPNLRYENNMTILQLIKSGMWKKPETHESEFSPDLLNALK